MVKVDQDTCIGCGSCVAVAPKIFEMDSNGKAKVKDSVEDPDEQKAKEGANVCPVNAIKV